MPIPPTWRLRDCSPVLTDTTAVKTGGRPSAHAFNLAVDTSVTSSDPDQAERYFRDMLPTFDMDEGRRTDAHRDTACYDKAKVALEDSHATITVSEIGISEVLRSHLRA